MDIVSIRVSQKSRLGLTDYNSVDLETSIAATLSPEDDPDECLEELTEMVRESIRERAKPFLPYVVLHKGVSSVEVTELYQGRPVVSTEEQS